MQLRNRRSLKEVLLGLSGVLGIGILGSALWELLFKPGVSAAGRALLYVLTLGSSAIRDYAYEGAAFDPTPVSALALYIPILALPFALALGRGIRRLTSSSDEHEHVEARPLPARVAAGLLTGIKVLGPISYIALIVAFAVHNQSVIIWRVFHNNLARIAPHISDENRVALRSEFAAVTSRADYIALHNQIAKVAEVNGVDLTNTETW